jgi:hypothetical protein
MSQLEVFDINFHSLLDVDNTAESTVSPSRRCLPYAISKLFAGSAAPLRWARAYGMFCMEASLRPTDLVVYASSHAPPARTLTQIIFL